MLTGLQRSGTAAAASVLLLAPLAAPSAAACAPASSGADLVEVVWPGAVPVSPLDVGSSRAEQHGAGTDRGTGQASGADVPVPGGTLTSRSGATRATASVGASGVRASAETVVEDLRLELDLAPLGEVVVEAHVLRTQAMAVPAPPDEGDGFTGEFSVAGLRVDDVEVVVPGPTGSVPVPGVGTLHVGERSTSSSGGSITALRLELDSGGSVLVARSAAQVDPGCRHA